MCRILRSIRRGSSISRLLQIRVTMAHSIQRFISRACFSALAAGFEAIVPFRYLRFANLAQGRLKAGGRGVDFLVFESPLLDMAGLNYLFWPFDPEPPPRFELVRRWGSLRVYRNSRALPRAYMVQRILMAADSDEAAQLLQSPDFDPAAEVILEGIKVRPEPPGRIPATVEWLDRTPGHLKLRVSAQKRGILVLSETNYPGWEATVDGTPTEILHANLAFRALPVYEGSHLVEFHFRPESVRKGGLGTALLFLVGGLYFLLGKVQRRRSSVPSL